eukprot:1336537-Pleurochrysis_carterae.AAC.3
MRAVAANPLTVAEAITSMVGSAMLLAAAVEKSRGGGGTSRALPVLHQVHRAMPLQSAGAQRGSE